MKNTTDITLKELAELLGNSLLSRGEKLAAAESCTGGWVSMLVTSIAGSSSWFDRGFVTYSNEAKQEMLAIDSGVIVIHGAVSEETVRHMVQGALENSHAQVALAVSGIAGPGGGSDEKPVGTVCFGWLVDGQSYTETCHFTGDREQIREHSVRHVLMGLLARLKKGGDDD